MEDRPRPKDGYGQDERSHARATPAWDDFFVCGKQGLIPPAVINGMPRIG